MDELGNVTGRWRVGHLEALRGIFGALRADLALAVARMAPLGMGLHIESTPFDYVSTGPRTPFVDERYIIELPGVPPLICALQADLRVRCGTHERLVAHITFDRSGEVPVARIACNGEPPRDWDDESFERILRRWLAPDAAEA